MKIRFATIALLIALAVGMLGCGQSRGRQQFYVRSERGAYYVALDVIDGTDVNVSTSLSLKDAEALTEKLNQDMAGRFNYTNKY